MLCYSSFWDVWGGFTNPYAFAKPYVFVFVLCCVVLCSFDTGAEQGGVAVRRGVAPTHTKQGWHQPIHTKQGWHQPIQSKGGTNPSIQSKGGTNPYKARVAPTHTKQGWHQPIHRNQGWHQPIQIWEVCGDSTNPYAMLCYSSFWEVCGGFTNPSAMLCYAIVHSIQYSI
jgi:hypothetical protein